MYSKLANKSLKKRIASKFYVDLKIFRDLKLSPSEAIVKFLKEQQGLTYRKIGLILGRDERNIWTMYNRVRCKTSKVTAVKAKKEVKKNEE